MVGTTKIATGTTGGGSCNPGVGGMKAGMEPVTWPEPVKREVTQLIDRIASMYESALGIRIERPKAEYEPFRYLDKALYNQCVAEYENGSNTVVFSAKFLEKYARNGDEISQILDNGQVRTIAHEVAHAYVHRFFDKFELRPDGTFRLPCGVAKALDEGFADIFSYWAAVKLMGVEPENKRLANFILEEVAINSDRLASEALGNVTKFVRTENRFESYVTESNDMLTKMSILNYYLRPTTVLAKVLSESAEPAPLAVLRIAKDPSRVVALMSEYEARVQRYWNEAHALVDGRTAALLAPNSKLQALAEILGIGKRTVSRSLDLIDLAYETGALAQSANDLTGVCNFLRAELT